MTGLHSTFATVTCGAGGFVIGADFVSHPFMNSVIDASSAATTANSANRNAPLRDVTFESNPCFGLYIPLGLPKNFAFCYIRRQVGRLIRREEHRTGVLPEKSDFVWMPSRES